MSDKPKSKVADALAEKKKQLQALRESRTTATPAPTPAPSQNEPAKADLDSVLKDIDTLIPTKTTRTPLSTSTNIDEHATPTGNGPVATHTTPPPTTSAPRRQFNLKIQSNVIQIDIPPKETPTYTKGTQTEGTTQTPEEDQTKPNLQAQRSRGGRYKPTKEEGEGTEDKEGVAGGETSKGEGEEATKEAEVPTLPELAPEEKTKILESANFKEFVERSARVIDRALYLSESLDIMKDFKTEETRESQAAAKEATLKATLFDERWAKHRSVTDLAWSTKHTELVLASYSANEAGSHDPDGVVLVWNANTFFQKPEFVFNCQSPVMTAQFSRFHATMVVGGTYSGQLVLWDTRAKAMPVQRTPLSAVGHTHPVYSLSIVGSANAHNLVSISTDGRMCVWSLENLSHPTETLELSNKLNKPVTAPVAVTSLSFPEGEVNSFLVGSEEGAIFQGYRHGATSGITERYDGHFGPITATDFHPARGNIDFSHLFLSSSTDWTCKLWSSKHGSHSIYSFEDATDYVYDARWAPTHPAVFATADGSGYLDVWDANEDTEVPIVKARASQRALNRLVWGADGRRIVAGDAAGYVFLYDVGDIAVPDANEWNRFEEVLLQLGAAKGPARPQDDDSLATPRDPDDLP